VDENQPSGTDVGNFSTTDPDAADTHTYSLVTGTGDTDNGQFTISGGTLKTNAQFNFEVKNSYSVRVRTTDNGTPAQSFEESFTISINDANDAPLATNDSYSGAIGNTKASVGLTVTGEPVVALTGNVLTSNDTDEDATLPHTLSAVAETVTSTGGGTATISSNGSFTFVPGVGDKNQSDTFSYHVTDGQATSTGTVTVGISNTLVWYVDNSKATNGDGRSTSPLNSLTGINGAGGSGDSDGPGDILFLYQGSGNYTGGLPLEASQQLIGQPNGLSVNNGVSNVTLVAPSGSNPTIANASGNAIALGTGNTIRSVNAGNASGSGISGSNFGTLDVGSVGVNTTGQALSLTTGTLSGSLSGVTSSGGTNNVLLSGVATGGNTFNLGSGSLSGATSDAFKVDGGNGSFSYSGTMGNATTLATNILNKTGGTVTLSGDINPSTAAKGISVSGNSGGTTVNFSGANKKINTGTGTGVNLSNNGSSGGATVNFTNGGLAITGTSNASGFSATGGGTMNVTGSGNTVATSSGTPVNVANTSIGAGGMTWQSVTATGAATNGISLTGASGPFTVTGATNLGTAAGSGPTGVGINVANWSSGALSFGSVDIQRRGTTGILFDNFGGSSAGFGATTIPNQNNAGGHGIRIEDSSSAVTVASANISNANQTVAQTDSDNNGFPDNDADGDAIFLKNNTDSFTLNGGTLLNNDGDGIDIRTASNLTLNGVTINGVGAFVGTTGNAGGIGGHGIFAWNLTGTNAITNSTITNWEATATNGLRWWVQGAGVGTMTVKGTTFSNSGDGTETANPRPVPSNAILYRGDNSSNTSLTVGGTNPGDPCAFTNIMGEAIGHGAGHNAGSTATANLTVLNNTFTGSPGQGQNTMSARNVEGGKATVVISGNTFDRVANHASDQSGVIDIGGDGLLAGNSISFTVTNNTIKNIGSNTGDCDGAGTGTLPCQGRRAIDVFIDDNTNVSGPIVVSGNTITNTVRAGIIFDIGSVYNGNSFTGKITNNTVGTDAAPVGYGTVLSAGGESGIRVESRSQNAKDLNVLVSGNSVRNGNGAAGSALNTSGLFLRTQNTGTMSATVTNNNINTNTAANAFEINVNTNFGAGGTLCADIGSGGSAGQANTLAAGAGTIGLGEFLGTLNVEQASATALATANGIPSGNVSITGGSPQFGVACAAPPS
jgi:hypothetical protein